jgi:hypothetical protein
VRLMLKNQIMVFNKLLEDQHRLMSKEQSSGVALMTPTAPNGSDSSTSKFFFFSGTALLVSGSLRKVSPKIFSASSVRLLCYVLRILRQCSFICLNVVISSPMIVW